MALEKIEKYRLQPYMPKRVQAVLDRVVEEYINQDHKYEQDRKNRALNPPEITKKSEKMP